ncbi:MAG TPA: AAA family ATPase, partial [Mycobacteriales bacterium]
MGVGAIVGRDAELSRLGSLVRAVADGHGGSAWVEGEPGIGKSALLDAGLAAAEPLGCRVFRGAAAELDRRFPLRVLLDCLQVSAAAEDSARRRILADLGDGPAGPGSADLVPAVAEGLLALVDELCVQPLVLVVDDLHWADEASLLVWQRLTRMAAQLPLLLVAACRPVPLRAELLRLRWGVLAAGTELVELGPLADGPVAELVGGLLGARSVGTALRRTVARAAGNPLYVREMVDALVRERRVRTEAGTVELTGSDTDPSVPLSLAAAISDRLDFLTGTALEELRSATLVGADFSVTELALLTGRSASELAATIEETVRAGVLAEAGVRLGFRHPLIRQVLYDSTPAALRFALHRQAARTFADAGAPPEQVAQQLLAALPETDGVRVVDDWVPDWLAGPGRALTYRAPQVAAELLERTVRQAELCDARRQELQTLLASVLVGLGRRAEAAEIADHVRLTSADPARAAEAAWTAAVALYGLLRADEAGRVLDAALAAPAAGVWPVRMRALRPVVRMMDGHFDQIGPARAALAAAEEAGDQLATAVASNALCGALHFAGETAAAVDVVTRELARLGDEPRTSDLRLLAMHNQVAMLGSLDRMEEADGVAREMLRAAERYGTPDRLTASRCGAAEHHFQAGQWDQAVAVLETATEDPYVISPLYELMLHGLLALIAAHRDDEAAALE